MTAYPNMAPNQAISIGFPLQCQVAAPLQASLGVISDSKTSFQLTGPSIWL